MTPKAMLHELKEIRTQTFKARDALLAEDRDEYHRALRRVEYYLFRLIRPDEHDDAGRV